ncbi:rhomboid family intramembrane serine protease [Lysobacter pythonis]|uniref:Rhomboid family intramembrane serine protease n=2 Tax=Solilutibacter pythonis TaxID=2483112 RepID=A0A3M2I3M3_9GAMM|nr:rhomboid family intramembrane serine protease [Lysobacter pythonis]RMH94580.1 rhomboid family intramembrane serine protease [Lysobacter pythonis]
MTIAIIVVTVLVSWRAFSDARLLDRLILWPPAISRYRQYDRLLTHGFIHADWMHLIFNMVTLFFFGRQIEEVFGGGMAGALGFLFFYLSAIVMAILPTWLRHRDDSHYRSLGASGGTSAVLFAFILFSPWSELLIFPIPVPIPAILFAVLYTVYSIWMDRRGRDNINHSAHLFGAAYGMLFMLVTWRGLPAHFLRELGIGG